MSKPARLLIFDLDGTLADTQEDLAGAVNIAIEKFGYPRRTTPYVMSCIGNVDRSGQVFLGVGKGAIKVED